MVLLFCLSFSVSPAVLRLKVFKFHMLARVTNRFGFALAAVLVEAVQLGLGGVCLRVLEVPGVEGLRLTILLGGKLTFALFLAGLGQNRHVTAHHLLSLL